MAQELTDQMIGTYIDDIRKLERIIEEHSAYILTINNKINNIKAIMKNNCNHIPTIDHNSMNEHTEYYCSRCLSSL
jgi:glycerol-3-phosphate responsive antiterminator